MKTKSKIPGFLLTEKSDNVKTGEMGVSTSPCWTCPNSCPFKKGNGCYSNYGPIKMWWLACTEVSLENPEKEYKDFLRRLREMKPGTIWRHNQAGDLFPADKKNPVEISLSKADQLVKANAGKRGFTYSNYGVIKGYGVSQKNATHNLSVIFRMNQCGFTVNVSSNSPYHADCIIEETKGCVPVVTVLPENKEGKKIFKTPKGRMIVVCPATYRKDMTCLKCKVCMNPDRKTIIGFPAHGTGKRHCERICKEWTGQIPFCHLPTTGKDG